MVTIQILTGSTRPGRFNIQPASWVYELAKQRKNVSVELLDLEKILLPFFDEPNTPMMNKYTKEHTKDWSKKINQGDGYIWVTPEYNHSYSPALKNAIDYLLYEWNFKPVTFISYGSEAGGSRAVEHLRGIAAELKMYDLKEQVMLPNYWNHTNDTGEYQFSEEKIAAANSMLDTLIFWAEQMKAARKKL